VRDRLVRVTMVTVPTAAARYMDGTAAGIRAAGHDFMGENHMLWTLFVVLLVLWLLGVVSAHTFGGFIHILLVIAVAMVLIRVIQGRRPIA
jgi:hypothetical protein